MMDFLENKTLFSSTDVATYVVCPEAWRIKYTKAKQNTDLKNQQKVKELRQLWITKQDLFTQLKYYAKISFLLLLGVVIIVFILEHKRITTSHLHFLSTDSKYSIPFEIAVLIGILGLVIFIWDLFERRSKKIHQESGLTPGSQVIALKGSSKLPNKQYKSVALQLYSNPDALIKENNSIIPVDIRPTSNKVQDRHVAQLLVHLRLIEEVDKIYPPYGILLMGPQGRRVVIKNDEQKQRWIDTLIDEMNSILQGTPALPTPSYQKCKNCEVRTTCKHSAYKD